MIENDRDRIYQSSEEDRSFGLKEANSPCAPFHAVHTFLQAVKPLLRSLRARAGHLRGHLLDQHRVEAAAPPGRLLLLRRLLAERAASHSRTS